MTKIERIRTYLKGDTSIPQTAHDVLMGILNESDPLTETASGLLKALDDACQALESVHHTYMHKGGELSASQQIAISYTAQAARATITKATLNKAKTI